MTIHPVPDAAATAGCADERVLVDRIRALEDATDHAAGGATSVLNGQGLCEQCNHTKQAPGWTARPSHGPPGQPHAITTELPTGHQVTTTAPPTPEPATVQPISHGELHLTRIALDYAA